MSAAISSEKLACLNVPVHILQTYLKFKNKQSNYPKNTNTLQAFSGQDT